MTPNDRSSATEASQEEFTVDVMQVQGKLVETRVGMVSHSKLQFYSENPRVYSIVREEGKEPTQDEIQSKLETMEHVRALTQDIKRHGGLIDPLVVKGDTLEVVEGNSRLAAFRVLARQNPMKWTVVKCRLLPTDMDDRLIASLLGQWHLKGKKEWPPYEQAGYLYRRSRVQGIPTSSLASEAGLSQPRVEKMIDAYQLMVDHGDTKRERWSYYDEFVKSRKIAAVRESHPGFEERVVSLVKSGELSKAQDLRDMLPAICAGPPKVLARFVSGRLDFDEAYEAARDAGGDNTPYQKLRRFRLWLGKEETQDALLKQKGPIREKVDFELRKLETVLSGLARKHRK